MKMDKVAGSKDDLYYTPKYAIKPIMKYLKPNSYIWCPFDTKESNYVKLFTEAGHDVLCTHIDNGVDFLKLDNCSMNYNYHIDYIISNPPYSLRTSILKKLFDINIPFAMLLGVVGLFESKERFNMFKNNKFEVMYFDKRVSFFFYYNDPKPSVNPPFSTGYVCHNILPQQIVFEEINKKEI